MVPYDFRHAGASHDMLERRRSELEIKGRGRWKTDSSLRRCGEPARAAAASNAMQLATAAFGKAVARKYDEIFNRQGVLPPLPDVH